MLSTSSNHNVSTLVRQARRDQKIGIASAIGAGAAFGIIGVLESSLPVRIGAGLIITVVCCPRRSGGAGAAGHATC